METPSCYANEKSSQKQTTHLGSSWSRDAASDRRGKENVRVAKTKLAYIALLLLFLFFSPRSICVVGARKTKN